ncbi:hypothetical protein [Novosphingobium aureum]|nr:hypothetical protein [Novosphingobium aureum]
MAKSFTWERGPFEQCPRCGEQTFGFLSAGCDVMMLRCTKCRYSHGEVLPKVDKATIYLDQFMFSSIFKIKAGGRAPLGQQDFYDELIPLLRRVVLLQQAILPHSDLHSNETIVFHDPRGLRDAYEDIGGDASLRDSREIELNQVFAFARAFRDGGEPQLTFIPDEILQGARNDWLPDMRISVNADYSQFADGIRRERDRGFAALSDVVAAWAEEKPSFHELLRRESQFGQHRRAALVGIMQRMANAGAGGDGMDLIYAVLEPVWREFLMLRDFLREGASDEEAMRRVGTFWDWERVREMPFNRIFAHLFAAFGRRVTMGQRKFTRGLMTDFRAIAAYAPYVDAMFVDRECALLLKEGELRRELHYRAHIYSYANKDEFLVYLRKLEAQATKEVRGYAERIYGVV